MNINTKTNKSFCLFPWFHSYMAPNYDRRLCCHSYEIIECKKMNSKDWWNSEPLKKIRINMINGIRNNVCEYCYNDEDNNIFSVREYTIKDYSKEYIQTLLSKTDKDGTLHIKPTYYLPGSTKCNLQCISCSPHFSSKNLSLYKKLFPEDETLNHVRDKEFEKEICEEIKSALREKTLKTIWWQGGEPMLSKENWDLWKEIYRLYQYPAYRNYLDSILMIFNTNMTVLYYDGKFIPNILKLLSTKILASIDGTHETLEYTRDGAKWKDVKFNWDQYHKVLNHKQKMGLGPVLTSPVIMDIDRMFDFFEPYDPIIAFHRFTCSIEYPRDALSFLDIRLFPQHIFDRVIDNALNRFKKSSIEGLETGIAALECYQNQKLEKADFFNDMDMLREIKKITIKRDQHLITKRSYGELLKIIDQEAYEWYINL